MARTPAPKDIEALRHQNRRVNNPTAEMAPVYEQSEELMGVKWKAMKLERAFPLAAGETRARDADLDPQIVWNGVRITLTQGQREKLQETGEVEIGDAQLVWRGKDTEDWSDLVVNAPPLYIQEKVHPKAIIDDLKRRTTESRASEAEAPDLFADFNGLKDPEDRYEFYRHSMHWQNRFILGDSLQVMASLAQREGLKGKVQAIYFDPPYGIKFNSNWQVSTLSRDVKDGKAADITREPEQVKAFRDTWKDGIHSYLTYLRDRLTVARELLTESGSIFVQISDENVHRVRGLMDEVFGAENFVSQIFFKTTSNLGGSFLGAAGDYIIWYARKREAAKYRQLYKGRGIEDDVGNRFTRIELPGGDRRVMATNERGAAGELPGGARIYRHDNLTSRSGGDSTGFAVHLDGIRFTPGRGFWKTNEPGMRRLIRARRVAYPTPNSLGYVRFIDDFAVTPFPNVWTDTQTGAFTDDKTYVVQTNVKVIERCLLMATDPGDLVLDPTCGSGTTATVAEQWGRRWITIDTSRVALALARTRLMSARYPYYLLADSSEGRNKEGQLTGRIPSSEPSSGDIRQGFVYERAPHIMLGKIANNVEIDIIWDKWQAVLEPLREQLNIAVGFYAEDRMSDGAGIRVKGRPAAADSEPRPIGWQEWEIPRDLDQWYATARGAIFKYRDNAALRELHTRWWEARIARQGEIDASIARAADVELLYDRPYEDKSKVRVAGPFTVESLSPHRVVTSRDDSLGDELLAAEGQMQVAPKNVPESDFAAMVIDNLKRAGLHQKDKADTIQFNSIEPWPSSKGWLGAEARYTDGEGRERRAGVLIGPEFGTLTHSQIAAAAREAASMRFDALIACAFNFDAIAGSTEQVGPLPILKARMNPDLHMADELKATGKGNLFVVFGEPDIDIVTLDDGRIQIQVNGVDVFDPSTGDIRSDGKEGIACWFIDTDYNEESFFVRHAYFLGANDPYKSLKTALRAEIDEDAWATLYSDVSRPFARPKTGRIAVKVINHFGDEVLKVFGV